MSATVNRQKPKQKKSNQIPSRGYAATVSVIVGNLINMIAVFAVSGSILLGLLAAKHFLA
jgi:hypothetical protein